MKKGKSLNEELNKIKFMLGYDSSKTRIENEETVNNSSKSLNEQGNDFATGAVTGAAAKPAYNAVKGGVNYVKDKMAAKAAASAAGKKVFNATGKRVLTTAALRTAGGIAATETLASGAGAVTIGSAFLGLSAATVATGGIALVAATGGLIYWLATSGDSNDKVKKLFDYCKKNRDKISKIPRGLSDEQITALSDRCYDDIQGIGTNNKDLADVFVSLVTVSDFLALVDKFGNERGDLYEWIKGDMDTQGDWEYIYRPLRNIVNDSLLKLKEEIGTPTEGEGQKPPVATTPQIPSELGDVDGVRKFQDWLDIAHPGWHDKYGTLNADVQRGYGIFGPRTTAAWAKYKTEFLGGGSTSVNRPEYTQKVVANSKPLTPKGGTVQGNKPAPPIAGLQTKR